jgi:hypothetical protein
VPIGSDITAILRAISDEAHQYGHQGAPGSLASRNRLLLFRFDLANGDNLRRLSSRDPGSRAESGFRARPLS